MVAKNDITGDLIKSKNSTKEYGDRYDAIFRKQTPEERDQAKYEDEAFESIETFNKFKQENKNDTGK